MRGTRTDWTIFVTGWLFAAMVIAGPSLMSAVETQQQEEKKLRETDWSKRIAADFRAQGIPAETEFVCPDGSRVDVLTTDYAYEVEWAAKWKESIGQAVFYGIATNRQPGVILLMDKDQTEYLRCAVVCGKLGIRLETRSVK